MTQLTANVLQEYLTQNASNYLDGQNVRHVTLGSIKSRVATTLYEFTVTTQEAEHAIMVKVPRPRISSVANLSDKRPVLVPPALDNKYWQEYMALSAIYQHFGKLQDARFDAIRVYDFIPEHKALVMAISKGTSLSKLFLNASPVIPKPAPEHLVEIFQNCGAWLRAYQDLQGPDHVSLRHTTKKDFIEAVDSLIEYLERKLGRSAFFSTVTDSIHRTAYAELPETLPLGLGHGDYAMRNILVTPKSRITVIDTLAKWQVPIYEDIGYFLTGLYTNKLQTVSMGFIYSQNQLSQYERGFLNGYFSDESIPTKTIMLYKALAVLDKWTAMVEQSFAHRSTIYNRAMFTISNLYYRRYLNGLLS